MSTERTVHAVFPMKAKSVGKVLRYLYSRFHPSKHIRRISRGGFSDLDECKDTLRQVAHRLSGVMSASATIDYICTHRASIARFGDGEYTCISGRGIPFQKKSKKLKERLLEILSSEPENCLIAFQKYDAPDLERIESYDDLGYWDGCFAQVGKYFLERVSAARVYGNALVSRLPAFEEGGVENVKRLWEGRDVVLVTGKGSAFELDQRLFHNLTSVAYLDGLARHAFSEYDALLNECSRFDKDKLFLIALGPTATVLAYDLSQQGYQALDIGHLPNCFHEFLGEKGSPEREQKKKKQPQNAP